MARFSVNELRYPTMPHGTVVASFRNYRDAQAAVDKLADAGFPVETTTIVGSDLHIVERITGRLTLSKVVASSLMQGAWFGMLIGLFYVLFAAPESAVPILLGGVAMGAAFGLAAGVIPYLLSGGERDFSSAKQVVASRYDVLATTEVGRVRSLLAGARGAISMTDAPIGQPGPTAASSAGAAGVAAAGGHAADGPTQFGSRADEEPKFGVRLSPEQLAAHLAAQKARLASATDPKQGEQSPAGVKADALVAEQGSSEQAAKAQETGERDEDDPFVPRS
ncbi:general stress protein [Buchananella hordeovulneris]|uniref:general stress protein n=1 Tax=Buchananella hordeovulneris TaxID=52770 RepID=UPI000F5DA9DE|nr:general stress protein [Buchananella hordeovulneris]RRD43561.1 hypothetical protein EII13_06355 [Buchananella hordeovulneris]RRD52818.1 hypothetical protein EII12_03565 [Buchananella hordeovulneris]